MQRERERERERERQRERETETETEGGREGKTDRQTDRGREGQRASQPAGQTDRDRQTGVVSQTVIQGQTQQSKAHRKRQCPYLIDIVGNKLNTASLQPRQGEEAGSTQHPHHIVYRDERYQRHAAHTLQTWQQVHVRSTQHIIGSFL